MRFTTVFQAQRRFPSQGLLFVNKLWLWKAALGAFIIFVSCSGAFANDINWSNVKGQKTILFYPGVTSWEFLTGDDHRLGGREIKKGRKDCRKCHLSKDGELDLRADEIASGAAKMKRSGNPFEPEPLRAKSGFINAEVKAAFDSEFLYVRVEWDSKGASWQVKKNAVVSPDRVSIQMNKGEQFFVRYGCFIACHNDLNTMPASPSKKEVASNPYYSFVGRDDVRLYAFYARDSWLKRKSAAELDKKLKEGGRIEVISAELAGGEVSAKSGWIFDDRVWDAASRIAATGAWNNDKYSIVFKRRLRPNDPKDISLKPGAVVSAGIAVHDDGAVKRRHYVSFPFTVGLDADADVRAVKVQR